MAWIALFALGVIIISSVLMVVRIYRKKHIEKKFLYGFGAIYTANALLMATVPYDGFTESIQYFLFVMDIGLFAAVLVSMFFLGTATIFRHWLLIAGLTAFMDVVAYSEFTFSQNMFDSTVWLVAQCLVIYSIMLNKNISQSNYVKYALLVSYGVAVVSFAAIPPTNIMESVITIVSLALIGTIVFRLMTRKEKKQKLIDNLMSKAVDVK